MNRTKLTFGLFFVFALVIGIWFNTKSLVSGIGLNILSISSTEILMNNKTSTNELFMALSDLSARNCRTNWFSSLLAESKSMKEATSTAISSAIKCSNEYIPLAWARAPGNEEAALLATKEYPNNGYGWFWLAELRGESAPEEAIRYYNTGLRYRPAHAWGWIELGRLLEHRDQELAVQAFLRACYLGDPGKHGCYNAGRITEQLGDFPKALEYYRLSTFDLAIENARRLEAKFNAK